MVLSDKDLNKIGGLIDEKIGKAIDGKIQPMFTKEIGLLRLEMNQRFDEAREENKKEHQEIIEKVEQVRQMETEDIQMVYTDITKIKKKIGMKVLT